MEKNSLLWEHPVDMGKSIDELSTLVAMELGRNPSDRCLYVFLNRARDKVKLLTWDRYGFWLLYKRLEQQRFHWPDWFEDDSLVLSAVKHDRFLDGYNLSAMRPHRVGCLKIYSASTCTTSCLMTRKSVLVTSQLKEIGTETSEQLAIIPQLFYVIRQVVHKRVRGCSASSRQRRRTDTARTTT